MKLTRWQNPNLVSWSNFNRLSDLRDEIDRLFDLPLTGLSATSPWMSGWSPALDVYEDKDQFVITAELPGMKKEDIELSIHNGSLTLSGERKSEHEAESAGVYRAERYFGKFQRSVDLPAAVATDRVKAEYKDGVLTVTLPKAEEAKPKQISVNVK